MRKKGMAGLLFYLFAAISTGALAQGGGTQDGRSLAASCAACHGTQGRSTGVMPVLAGIDKAALIAAMQAFKHGLRPGTIMPQLAKGYSDLQIADMAEFFSRQKPRP